MSSPTPAHEFDADTIAQVAEYMNTGQPQSLCQIAIAATGDPGIHSARIERFDGHAVTLSFESDRGPRTIEVKWPRSITQRFEVRGQLIALYERALDDL